MDTNVLVALVEERERLHAVAKRDLKRLERRQIGIPGDLAAAGWLEDPATGNSEVIAP